MDLPEGISLFFEQTPLKTDFITSDKELIQTEFKSHVHSLMNHQAVTKSAQKKAIRLLGEADISKLILIHCDYENVAIVNEYNFSKICSYCFLKLFFIELTELLMERNKLDTNAAANIALSGESVILATDNAKHSY
ncbi:hypothetical protein Glove_593g21 [Diversispora epigaea]|uniref:Uncharacterized protein n=1 Tax=Diversispora epigaea TaxID=1348612 RepID=A0A397GG68_9GLOM|nr:hypothetical protein Glove_593g21 [Diversispora epigaea]